MRPIDATRYPLSWPLGWTRTLGSDRQVARFAKTITERFGETMRKVNRRLSVGDAVIRLSSELDRLGAENPVLSTNIPVRLDGLPRSGQAEPHDPGVAVYFTLKGAARCLACDRWSRVADNIGALAQHIDALRRIDRYGVGSLDQAFAGYAALPPDAATDWWMVLGVDRKASPEDIERAFREKARRMHPDLPGGSHDEMARLTAAITAARNR